MDREVFNAFDNACMAGDLKLARAMLRAHSPSQSQLNTALRHAAAYAGPSQDVREDVVDALIDRGATVDWDDRGMETITNAPRTASAYVLKRILNATDGNVKKLTAAATILQGRKGTEWAAELIELRKQGELHIGL